MAYATQQDLVDRFGAKELIELTDRTNRPASTIDAGVVATALNDATAQIDTYLAVRYALPLTVVPANLPKLAADIARYNLHGKAADKDGAIARNYANAVAWLDQVSKGLLKLEAGGVPSPPVAGGNVRFSASDPAFTRDNLRGM